MKVTIHRSGSCQASFWHRTSSAGNARAFSYAPASGYALLDVVLAVAVFAIAITGIVGVLHRIGETSSEFARDRHLQQRIEALLAEKRRLPVGSMASESVDPLSGVRFRTYVEPWQIDNGEGAALADLYKLTAEAVFVDDGGEQVEKAELIVHVKES